MTIEYISSSQGNQAYRSSSVMQVIHGDITSFTITVVCDCSAVSRQTPSAISRKLEGDHPTGVCQIAGAFQFWVMEPFHAHSKLPPSDWWHWVVSVCFCFQGPRLWHGITTHQPEISASEEETMCKIDIESLTSCWIVKCNELIWSFLDAQASLDS